MKRLAFIVLSDSVFQSLVLPFGILAEHAASRERVFLFHLERET